MAKVRLLCATLHISIHALRKESDFVCTVGGICLIISIHALRKESDFLITRALTRFDYFNPRSP